MIRFRLVSDHQTDLPVKRMCELLELPRSTFYARRNHSPSARDRADTALLVTIRDIYQRSRGTYGVPRVYGQLRRNGVRVARSRVARLMRADGLVGGAHRPQMAARPARHGRPGRSAGT